jgi:hypothetical protein
MFGLPSRMRNYQSLVDRNADNCEAARCPRCRCGCMGAMHGMAHSAQWRAQQVESFHERQHEREREKSPQAALL